jgi:hypothetical protein
MGYYGLAHNNFVIFRKKVINFVISLVNKFLHIKNRSCFFRAKVVNFITIYFRRQFTVFLHRKLLVGYYFRAKR